MTLEIGDTVTTPDGPAVVVATHAATITVRHIYPHTYGPRVTLAPAHTAEEQVA